MTTNEADAILKEMMETYKKLNEVLDELEKIIDDMEKTRIREV